VALKSILYHGSRYIIPKPVYGEGNPHNDYGLGFYCTHEIDLAKEWACTEESSGYANQYELDNSGLSTMRLSGAEYNILNWLAILLDNRTFRVSNDIAREGKAFLLERFLPDITAYDIMIGYRADDSYFAFANAFLNNALSLERLEKAMYLGRLGEQTVLKSEKAFKRINFISAQSADREIYYPMRSARDRGARASYSSEYGSRRSDDSIYLVDILRGGWENYDPRLRRNISG